MKADKGNTLVILNSDDYVNKCENFLSSPEFEMINSNPTDKYQKDTKKLINSSQIIYSPKDAWKLTEMNPRMPLFYGQPKLHKPNAPIRPVVSFCGAPSYKLAQCLNSKFKEYSNFSPKYGVKNSLELVDKLKDKNVTRGRLISFDVSSLFTNVPVKDTVRLAEDLLLKNKVNPVIINELMDGIDLCSKQTYFMFNQNIYMQKEGLAMGSPLSPLLAEIFMDNFEKTVFSSKNPLTKQIGYWFRYVDDVLCLWLGTDRQLNKFHTFINSVHPKIKFTLEIETNQAINFLDLNISVINGKHQFKIYRKETFSDTLIPSISNHPWSQKMAAFHSMLFRLINVPLSNQDYKEELDTILQIAEANGYARHNILKLLNKKEQNKLLRVFYTPGNETCNKNLPYIRMAFYEGVSTKIAKILKDSHKVAYYTTNNIKKSLFNAKDKVDTFEKSGVYELSCGDCDAIYIGQTGRNFQIRTEEHFRHWQNKNKNKSNFADHLLESNHSFDPIINTKILHTVSKSKHLSTLETFEIQQATKKRKNVVNIIQNYNFSPLFNF